MKYERYKKMNKLNTLFLNEYTLLEELCNEKYGVQGGGIEAYLGAMLAGFVGGRAASSAPTEPKE